MVVFAVRKPKRGLKHRWKEKLNTQQNHCEAGKEPTGKKMPYA